MLASRCVTVIGYDGYEPTACLWNAVLDESMRSALVDEALSCLPDFSKEDFYLLKAELRGLPPILNKGAAHLVLNRASGGLCRNFNHRRDTLTAPLIERIRHFDCPNLTVEFADYRDSIPTHDGVFLYVDPPYDTQSNDFIYGYNGELHRDFDHYALAELVKKHSAPWILSYNSDSPRIRHLYKRFRQWEPPHWSYGIKSTASRELLIFGDDLELPPHVQAVNPRRIVQVQEPLTRRVAVKAHRRKTKTGVFVTVKAHERTVKVITKKRSEAWRYDPDVNPGRDYIWIQPYERRHTYDGVSRIVEVRGHWRKRPEKELKKAA
ncbi:MAG: DNA adenine methylase [Pseudomonadota bacterium]